MLLTLGQAAKLAGKGKTTLTRAIQAGRLSATRLEDGSYRIDPAELCRVYDVRAATPETVTRDRHVVHHETPYSPPPPGEPPNQCRGWSNSKPRIGCCASCWPRCGRAGTTCGRNATTGEREPSGF